MTAVLIRGSARSASCPVRPADHVTCASQHANFARHAMHAHRLWIKLWISLGRAEENPAGPGGNEVVTPWWLPVTHSRTARRVRAHHTRCARLLSPLPGRTEVIPKFHRPYDYYETYYLQISTSKEGDR